MIAQHFIGYLIGYSIGFAILAVFSLLRRQMWLRRADMLARQSNNALPLGIEDRVARFLRNEFFLGQFVVLLTMPALSTLVVATLAASNWAKWLPWILVSLPLYLVMVGIAASLWPRWKASSRYRVTHLGSMSTRHAFTPAEFAAVQIQWWPILLPVATLVLLTRVFRRGRGLWRRAWLDRNGLG